MTRLLLEDGRPVKALVEFAELNGIRRADKMSAQQLSNAMQRQWFQIGKLRYQIEGESPGLENLQLLQDLGHISPVLPPSKRYNGQIILLGALASRVRDRFAWYIKLLEAGYISKDATLYMLGSERPLSPEKESREILLSPHDGLPSVIGWEPPKELPKTESGMMRMIAERAGMRSFNIRVIDTPIQPKDDGNFRIPNTADTVLTWLQEGTLGDELLVISNNPFVEYQALTVWRAIAKTTGINAIVEGTGPEANRKLPLATFRDNIAKQLYEELEQWKLKMAL